MATAQIKTLKPGWNLFSPQQDVQLGKEAAAQVQQKMQVVHNPELETYLNNMLNRLKAAPHASKSIGTEFPFTIAAVYDKNINAFSLPGGPLFVNTGLLQACDNEAQLAGVLGHEMSHVVLRHSTNQISKQNLVSIPAMLTGAVFGHGILGQLAQLGVGVGANGMLLKFSRTDESQADYNGALIAAEAGYNPLEMAHFFEKLEAQSGRKGVVSQLLSDHPNPGNRVQAVEAEIRQMPQTSFTTDSGQFPHIKDLANHIPAPNRLTSTFQDEHAANSPSARPAGGLREYKGSAFAVSYPSNWQVFGDQQSNMVTIAPQAGLVKSGNGAAVGYGMEVSYYFPKGDNIDLRRDTQALIDQLRQQNSGMNMSSPTEPVDVGGQRGLMTTLTSQSPFQGETEIDTLITVPRPEGLFYIVLIAPQSEAGQIRSVFRDIVASVRFQ